MAQKGKIKLRDLGSKKNREQIQERIEKTKEIGQRREFKELRLKEKAANERMRQLEKAGIKSPAYQAVQAKLEILKRPGKGDRGRRFSETGRATYSEMEVLNKILDDFLNMKTATLKGAKQYERDVWESANKNQKLAQVGITKQQWLDFWDNMPNKEKDRLYSSSQNVAMVRAFTIKRDKLRNMSDRERRELIESGKLTEQQLAQFMDDTYSVKEIADDIQASENLKAAYNQLGLTYKEVSNARIKRTNK